MDAAARAPAPVEATALPRLGNLRFAVLALYWVAIGYLWQSLGTLILPDAVQQIVGSAAKGRALSLLEGIGTIVAIVWQPVAGTLSDRTRTRFGRRRPYIVVGTAGDLVFLTGLALSGAFWPLVVFYTLLQLSSNSAQGPYQGLAPDVVPETQRGTASGFYGIANLVGTLGGTVVAGLLLAHAGRPGAVASIAALLLFAMLVTVLGVREPPPPPRLTDGVGSPWDVVRSTFTTPLAYPDFVWLMGSRLLILMAIVGIQSFVLFYYADTYFGGSTRAATTATTALVGLVVLLAILVTWPAARLSDRVGRKAMIVGGGVIATVGMLMLLFSGFSWLPEAILAPLAATLHVPAGVAQTFPAGALIGIGLGAFLSVDWAFITDLTPPGQAGLFFGFSNIATAGAGVIARFVAGFLLDHFNAGPKVLGLPGGYPVLFAMFTGWLVLGTILVLPIRQRR
ncbi:MAG: MFS transporter [Candidatus Dormibacteraeota bacterium]|nr:MFS transporter [Candidatus Dormibacteraeota bacterium]